MGRRAISFAVKRHYLSDPTMTGKPGQRPIRVKIAEGRSVVNQGYKQRAREVRREASK